MAKYRNDLPQLMGNVFLTHDGIGTPNVITRQKLAVIIEDEPALAELIHDYLTQARMTARILNSYGDAVEQILELEPDLVILEIMLPGKDGLTVCRELRAKSDVPIVIQTARVEEIDCLLGFELGADDYIYKPWSPRELIARVRAVLRRAEMRRVPERTEAADTGLCLSFDSWVATFDGKPLNLTRRELQVLAVLYKRPGRVYSRDQLIELAFPDDSAVIDRTIDSHIRNIRRKFAAVASQEDIIRSVYGVGYAYDG